MHPEGWRAAKSDFELISLRDQDYRSINSGNEEREKSEKYVIREILNPVFKPSKQL